MLFVYCFKHTFDAVGAVGNVLADKNPTVKVKLLLLMHFLLVKSIVSVVIMAESACQNSFHNIKHELTSPYSPHQIDTAERS